MLELHSRAASVTFAVSKQLGTETSQQIKGAHLVRSSSNIDVMQELSHNCAHGQLENRAQNSWGLLGLFHCCFAPARVHSPPTEIAQSGTFAANSMEPTAPEVGSASPGSAVISVQQPWQDQDIQGECHDDGRWYSAICCGWCKSRTEDRVDGFEANRVGYDTTIMYHGTSSRNADNIERFGFQQSRDGMLGAGVYCSRNVRKAIPYAHKWKEDGGGVVFELRVTVGHVAIINYHGHPLQKCWHNHNYDCAWVPPHTMNPSGLEEHCVWDPARIAIIRRLSPADYVREAANQQQRPRRAQQRCLPNDSNSVKKLFAACWRVFLAVVSGVRSLGTRFLRFIQQQHSATQLAPQPQVLPPITRPRLRSNYDSTRDLHVAVASKQNASMFWSRIIRGFKLFGEALVKAAKIVGRAVVVTGVYAAVSSAVVLKAAASGLRNLMARMQLSHSPSLRINRVQPMNVHPVSAVHVSSPAPILLRVSTNLIQQQKQQQQQQRLGFWTRAANVVKAIATATAAAASVIAATADAAGKHVAASIAAAIMSLSGAMARIGSRLSQFSFWPSTSSTENPDCARISSRAIEIDQTAYIPCERYDAAALFKKWCDVHLAIVGDAVVCSKGANAAITEMASARHVLPLRGCCCRAEPAHTRRNNILALFWPNDASLPAFNFAFAHAATRDSFIKHLESAMMLQTLAATKMVAETVLSSFLLTFHKRKALIQLTESTASMKSVFKRWVQVVHSSKIRAAKLASFRLRLSAESMSKSVAFELELSRNMGMAKCMIIGAEARAAAKQKARERATAAAKQRVADEAKARAALQAQFVARLDLQLKLKYVRKWMREGRRMLAINKTIRAKNAQACKSAFETWWSKTTFHSRTKPKHQPVLKTHETRCVPDDCVQPIIKHASGVWEVVMHNNWMEGA